MIYYSQYAPAASLDSRSRIIAIGRAPRAGKYNSQEVGRDHDSERAVVIARSESLGEARLAAGGGGDQAIVRRLVTAVMAAEDLGRRRDAPSVHHARSEE